MPEGVEVAVAVGVPVPVPVGVFVGVFVGVADGLPHVVGVYVIRRPVLMPPVLHSNWLNIDPVSLCRPTVAESPVLFIVPYTKSMMFDVSCRRISKLAVDAGVAK